MYLVIPLHFYLRNYFNTAELNDFFIMSSRCVTILYVNNTDVLTYCVEMHWQQCMVQIIQYVTYMWQDGRANEGEFFKTQAAQCGHNWKPHTNLQQRKQRWKYNVVVWRYIRVFPKALCLASLKHFSLLLLAEQWRL